MNLKYANSYGLAGNIAAKSHFALFKNTALVGEQTSALSVQPRLFAYPLTRH